MNKTASILSALLVLAQTGLALDTSSGLLAKPSWLTDASITLKEGYDDNVLMSGVNQANVPPGTMTLKDRGSFVTTVSPKLGFNFATLVNSNSGLDLLSFVYAPDFVRYEALPAENYDAHRTLMGVKGNSGDFSYNFDNALWFVDGNQIAPAYPGGLYNAWASIYAYQRVKQVQDRTKIALQYDLNHWFIRPGTSLAYYGMMSEIKNPELASTPSGYQNYAPRYDVNGGMDVGYKLTDQTAATFGYRYGHTGQEQYEFSPYSSSSDYQRILAGFEGKPLHWLDVQLLGGPDFRDYQSDSATHITPVNDLHPLTYYGEANIAATLAKADALVFKYKQYQFVSCGGKIPYFDSSYGLTYHRKITGALSLDAGAKLLEADYNMGSLSACRRNDLDYIATAGLHYAFNAHVSTDLAYQGDFGRNDEDYIVNSSTRAFDRNLVSLGVQFGF